MLGAHGRLRWLLQEGWMLVPAKYYLLCEEPLPGVLGMVNPGAHYRSPAAWGAFCRMGALCAYNTIGTNVGAYNTVCVRAVVEHCSHRRTGYGPHIVV